MHIMIDIEAMGSAPDGIILSIGAYAFDFVDPAYWQGFYSVVDPNQGRTAGYKESLFWIQQPEAIRNTLFGDVPKVVLKEALNELGYFIRLHSTKSTKIWANGIQFDLAMLRHAYIAEFSECPWKYGQETDMRTLRGLENEVGLPMELKWKSVKAKMIEEGKGHIASEDAKAQALYVYNWVNHVNK